MVKRRDLIKEAEAHGLRTIGGANHDVYEKPGFRTTIPRHREISEPLANEIRKQAGIRKGC